jgi:hypothetical protein
MIANKVGAVGWRLLEKQSTSDDDQACELDVVGALDD